MFTQYNTQCSWFICALCLVLLGIGSVACGEDRDVVEEEEQKTGPSTGKGNKRKSGQKKGANGKRGEEVLHAVGSKDVPRQEEATKTTSTCLTSSSSHTSGHATRGAGSAETAHPFVTAEEATTNAYGNLSSQASSNTTAPQGNKDAREQPNNGHQAAVCTAVPVDDMVPTNPSSAQQGTPEDDMMHSQDVDTTVQTDTSHTFSIELKPETHGNSTCNFVLVALTHTIGMQLRDFSVTASLPDIKGIVRGGSGRKGTSFIYNKELNQCNLQDLFLQDVKKKDDSLTGDKRAVSFRVKVQPSATIKPGKKYMLTIEIRYTDGHLCNVYAETVQTLLEVPSKNQSPKKHAKRTT